jgi:hypothetical protein
MSASAAQAAAFYRDVARTRCVWTVRDAGGHPAPKNSRGIRAQPFWSSRSRVERIIKSVAAYAEMQPVEVAWEEFRDITLKQLAGKGFLVGVNWSGPDATGYDLSPDSVRASIEWQLEHGAPAA